MNWTEIVFLVLSWIVVHCSLCCAKLQWMWYLNHLQSIFAYISCDVLLQMISFWLSLNKYVLAYYRRNNKRVQSVKISNRIICFQLYDYHVVYITWKSFAWEANFISGRRALLGMKCFSITKNKKNTRKE